MRTCPTTYSGHADVRYSCCKLATLGDLLGCGYRHHEQLGGGPCARNPRIGALATLGRVCSGVGCHTGRHGFFASSAGAIYAGSTDHIISEDTIPAPTTAYAFEKIRQEELVRSFVRASDNHAALLARLSTVYGPGQSRNKQQGLLAYRALHPRNQPIQIYVPLDTMRDYINADDAAVSIIVSLRVASESPQAFIKIIASEKSTTIAEIISIFKRITRRAPRIVTSAGKLTSIYSHRMQFRSITIPQCKLSLNTTLLTGIAKVIAAERAAYVYGPTASHH
ncbi:MAG: NAD-dependent epimerase/dehydratase family protein [Candidatus Competibacteraceae bacterium]|nr:NAD-dependent epimerase/dehydratase family protein [Candidatus Competibacteraceae bacterium]